MEYIAFSGGCDSTAVALLLKEEGKDFELIFSDTGAELPETYWFIPRFAKAIGKKLVVLSNGTFYQHLINYNFLLPSPYSRWCTRLLKQVSQDRFFGDEDCIVHIGIRADESHRATLKPRSANSKHTFQYPLIKYGLDKKAVIDLCEKYDALNAVYQWRSNCSCFCCPFQRKSDWKGLLKHHPDLYALAEEWENQSISISGHSWYRGRNLKSIRIADETQLKLFPETTEEPCIICTI